VLDYAADRVVEVSTGNGAGLRVSWNGQDMGVLGGLDEVVTRLWTAAAILTPTSTISPTVTNNPLPTPSTTPAPAEAAT
jgi:hypothetical protein